MNKFAVLFAFVFFSFTVVGGVYAGSRSWNGVVYLTDGTIANNSRNPAAIKREIDYSKLDGAEVLTATQDRLVTAAKVIMKEGIAGVELGHFVARDADGQRRLACDGTYNRVTLRFNAEGMASGGETPSMEVDAPCTPSQKSATSLDPVWIPFAKILSRRAVDSDFGDLGTSKFKFTNMSGDWPVSWRLQSVRLYNSQEAGREVNISSREFKGLGVKPIVMNWR